MKKACSILILLLLLVAQCGVLKVNTKCASAEEVENIYSVFDEYGTMLLQKQEVYVGDMFLTKDYKKYEIVLVDEVNKLARAKFLKIVEKPEINISFEPHNVSQENPTICLYMTHNDESYITGDGVDSVYGEGGIHDIAKALQTQLQLKGVKTYLDETLHIPHDTRAYTRSNSTAKELINSHNPDGIFDIHRDGASRKTYVTKVNGNDRCKVRIVVGKASDNFEIAEQFALYLLAVSEKVCDWLFLDIYYATGHYNQGLHNKALLFEMGSHMVEKDLVLKSVEPLVNVLTTAMFNTTVNNNTGELTVNGSVTEDTPLITDAIDKLADSKNKAEKGVPMVLAFVLGGTLLLALITIGIYTKKRK